MNMFVKTVPHIIGTRCELICHMFLKFPSQSCNSGYSMETKWTAQATLIRKFFLTILCIPPHPSLPSAQLFLLK